MTKIGYVEDNLDFANLVKEYLSEEGMARLLRRTRLRQLICP